MRYTIDDRELAASTFISFANQMGSKLLWLAKEAAPTMLFFGAQPEAENFYEKNGCKKSLQSYILEKQQNQ